MAGLQIITGRLPGAIKTVIYGPEGIGKSTLAACFPRPLFIDTEGSTRFMEVARLPRPSSWSILMEQVRQVRGTPGCCATLVIDTADWAEQLCIEGICGEKRLRGIEDMGYGKGYVYLAEEFGRLLNLLGGVAEDGIHVVLTAHAAMRKFEQPDELGAYDRWELKLQKKTAPLVKEWADLLLFANYKTLSVAADEKGKKYKAQGGRRVMYTSHHPCWDAKIRLGLPEELPLEYAPLAPYFAEGPTAVPPAAEPVAPAAAPAAKTLPPPAPPAPPPQGEQLPLVLPPSPGAPREEPAGALAALRDLMTQGGVGEAEIRAAVAARGYFPEDTPIENYPEDFVCGVLIGAWPQVHQWIKDNGDLPF